MKAFRCIQQRLMAKRTIHVVPALEDEPASWPQERLLPDPEFQSLDEALTALDDTKTLELYRIPADDRPQHLDYLSQEVPYNHPEEEGRVYVTYFGPNGSRKKSVVTPLVGN